MVVQITAAELDRRSMVEVEAMVIRCEGFTALALTAPLLRKRVRSASVVRAYPHPVILSFFVISSGIQTCPFVNTLLQPKTKLDWPIN